MEKHHHGFSLIELLITLAIISILICSVYPSYSQHLVTVRRTSAVIALMDLAGKMEQYYVGHNTYTGATLNELASDDSSYRDYYQITLSAKNNAYTITATPLKAQAVADQLCATLSIDQEGNKTASGSGTIKECW